MATTNGLGGLPIVPPSIPVPLSRQLLQSAEQANLHEEQIHSQQIRINHLTASLSAAKAAVKEAQEARKARDGDVANWMAFAGKMEKDIETGKARAEKLLGEKQELQEAISRAEAESQKSREASSGVKAENQFLRAEKVALEEHLAGALTTVATASEQAQEFQTRIKTLEGDIDKLNEEANERRLSALKLRESFDECEEKACKLQKEKEEIGEKLTVTEAEVIRLKDDLESQKTVHEKVQTDNEDAAKKLGDMTELAVARQRAIEELEGTNAQLQSAKLLAGQALADAAKTAARLQSELELAQCEATITMEDFDVVNQKLEAATAQNSKLQTEANDCAQAKTQLQTEKSCVEKKLADAEAALKGLQCSNEQLTSTVEDDKKVKTELAVQVEMQSKALVKLRAQYQQCVRENTELHALHKTSVDTVTTERTVSAALRDKVTSLEGQIDGLNATEQSISEGLRDKVASLAREIDELYATIEGLQAALQDEMRTAERATALLVRQQSENIRHQSEMAEFLRSTTVTPAPLRLIKGLLKSTEDGQLKGDSPETTCRAPPQTPTKLYTQLPSPQTPSTDNRPLKASSSPRPLMDRSSTLNIQSAAGSAFAQAVDTGKQQSAELPCFGSPLHRDPRLRNRRPVTPVGNKRRGDRDSAGELQGRAGKRLCSSLP